MAKKIKGKKALNKTVSAMLEPFGISKAMVGGSYMYLFDKNTVIFQITEDIEDEIFSDFIKDRFNYEVKYPFIMSLLHEVGHAKANDNITDDIYDFCLSEKAQIEKDMQTAFNIDEVRKIEYRYFNLPDEIMATQWAVKYAKKHPKKIKKMNDKVVKALCNFYEKNGVEV